MVQDKDNDGVPDFRDQDADNDGITNDDEGAVTDVFDISSLDGLSGIDANGNPDPSIIEDALNNENINLAGAILTVEDIFTGGAGMFDEFEINDSQETGSFGIRLGVQGPVNGSANFVQSNYTFSQPVCDLNNRVVDLDRDDAIYIFGYNNGVLVPFTVTNQGGCLIYDGANTLMNNPAGGVVNGVDCNVNADPATGNVDNHAFDIQFNGCIDSLVFGIYDTRTTGVDGGGSFTFIISPDPTISGPDTDMDGVPDFQDLDSDNDGIPDAIEACGTMTIDLILEDCTLDSNGDGVYQMMNGINTGLLVDICATAPIDTDMDGIEDFRDLDSDADGCPDATEACTNDNPNVNDVAISDGYEMPANGANECGLVFDTDGVTTSCETPVSANWVDDTIECIMCVTTLLSEAGCNVENGNASVVASEGNGPYTYLWSNGETTSTATMLPPGMAMVTVTDDCGSTTMCSIDITEVTCMPCLDITKSSSLALGADGIASVGDVVSYSYSILNCGNDVISNVMVTENNATFTGTGILPVPTVVSPSTIDIGMTGTATSTYMVTQADIDAGFVDNQATAAGIDRDNNPVSDLSDTGNTGDVNETGGDDDPTNTPIDPGACIEITKGSSINLGADGIASPGDMVTYTYELLNCGNVTLSNMNVTEQAATFTGTGTLPTPSAVAPAMIAPGQTATATASYSITQADIDAGFIDNQVEATATDPSNMTVMDLSDTSNPLDVNETGGDDDPTNTPVMQDPCISLTKGSSLDVGADGIATPGDIITYTYQVTNCGNVTLDNIMVTEENAQFTGTGTLPIPGAVVPSTLAPGQSANATSTYAITQEDIDAELVENQALVTGDDPNGDPQTDLSDTSNPNDPNETGGPDDPTTTPITPEPCISLTKGSMLNLGADGVATPGDIVTYTYEANNCGNTTLTNVMITEQAASFSGTGTLPSPTPAAPMTLLPGQSAVSTSTYAITQTDIDNSFIDNQALTTGNDPMGGPVMDLSDTSNAIDVNETGGPDDPTNTPIGEAPCISLTKGSVLDTGVDGVATPGDVVTYSYEVTNCGNVTLDGITITENAASFSGTGILPVPGAVVPATLIPGQTATASSTYIITQMDIDDGFIDNQAMTTGNDPSGNPVTDLSDTSNDNDTNETGGPDDPTNTPIGLDPCIEITKGSSLNLGPDAIATPGDMITYTYTVINCGNVTVDNITITEQQASFTGTGTLPMPGAIMPDILSPGQTANSTSSYAITQADIDAGFIDNQALVSGTDPENNPVSDLSDTQNVPDVNETGGPDDPTNTPIAPEPCIVTTKGSSIDLGGDSVASVGDLISYTYQVENCGNVTLTLVTIDEQGPSFSGTGTLPVAGAIIPSTLAPGQSANSTSIYMVTQADIDAGFVDNQTLATGIDPEGNPTTDLSDTTNDPDVNETGGPDDPTNTPLEDAPCIALTKGSSIDVGADGVASPGDIITYTYTATNCGNVTLDNITFSEEAAAFTGTGTLPVIGAVTPTTITPGQSASATATYAITQVDIDAGFIDNQALASATDPENDSVTDLSDTSNPGDINETGGDDDPTNTPIAPDACVSLTKGSSLNVGPDGIPSPGDIVTYSYAVLNCGNVSLTNILITEQVAEFTGTGSLPSPGMVMPMILTPGQTGFANANYAITQADIDAGFIDNQALVTADDPDNNPTTDISDTSNPTDINETGGPDDPTNTPVDQDVCIEITKGSSLNLGGDGIASPGDVITYTYSVINCGNVTLDDISIEEQTAGFSGTSALPIPQAVVPSSLSPGQSANSTSMYMISQEDIDAGFVDNQALTSGNGPDGMPITDLSDTSNPVDINETGGDDDPTNTPIPPVPCINLTKGSSLDLGIDGTATPGDIITYTYEVTNCGNVTLTNVSVSEQAGSFSGTGILPVPGAVLPSALAPGESASVTSMYAITQTDIDNSSIDNQALAVGTDPDGTPVNDLSDTSNPNDDNETGGPDDPTNTPIGPDPCISLTKGSALDTGPDGVASPGDIIIYIYEVTNCGNVTLTTTMITEEAAAFTGTGTLPVPGPVTPATLEPGESATVTSTYIITQSDIDEGFVNNQATASANDPDGMPVSDLSDTSNSNDPNETGGPDDPTNTPIGLNPCLVLTKGSMLNLNGDGIATPGDIITYTYEVINCGNVTIENVTLTEIAAAFTGTGDLPTPSAVMPSILSPGQNVIATATYALTQLDIDAGFVDNQAMVAGTDPENNPVEDLSDTSNAIDVNETGGPDDPTNTPVLPEPCIELTKGSSLDAGADGIASAGDIVTYTYRVANCGNVTLTDVMIDEQAATFSGTGILPVPGAVVPSILSPGQSANTTSTYVLTQVDINNALLDNQAIASGNDPDDNPVTDLSDTSNDNDANETGGGDDPTNTPIGTNACIELLKGSALDLGADGIATPGDVITYTYQVTNCGTVTLTDIVITEEVGSFTGTGGLPIPGAAIPSTLLPGESATASATYAITLADIDAGGIDNQALATGNDPDGEPTTDLSDSSNPNDPNETGGEDDPTNTNIGPDPCIRLTKGSSLDFGADGVATPGDIITYTYDVTNCGNVTLSGVSISENDITFSGSGTLPVPGPVSQTTLEPGESATASATYAITLADINAGGIDNQALAIGNDPDGEPTTDLSDSSNPNDPNETGGEDDPTNTNIGPDPCISLTKGSSLDFGADGVATPGDIITYTYEVTNCGNVTLTDVAISENDLTFSGSGILPVPGPVSQTTIEPGESATASATYAITQVDIDAGGIDNQAIATGNDPDGEPTTDLSDSSNPNDPNDTGGDDDPTNTDIGPDPCIELLKGSFLELGTDGVASVGDIITYTYSVTNCGNVTLSNINITELDDRFTGTNPLPEPSNTMPAILGPGQTAGAQATYMLTQADIDAGSVINQAVVTAQSPSGDPVEDESDSSNPNDPADTGGEDDPTTTVIGENPCVELLKGSVLDLGPDQIANAGDVVTYTYTLRNCGNVTVSNLILTELVSVFTGTGTLPSPNALPVTTLLPGESTMTTANYIITQADVDAGEIINQALLVGISPDGDTVEDESDTANPNDPTETGGNDDPTYTDVGENPCVELFKGSTFDQGSNGVSTPGDIVTYSYTIRNCGNVTISNLVLSENNVSFTGTNSVPAIGALSATSLAPGETTSISSTYIISGADISASFINNQAVVSAIDPSGDSLSDLSDSSNDNDINETGGFDDPTNTPIEQPATISGTTFEDVDGDGDLDQVLPFVEVTLTDSQGNVQTTVSDENGDYTFTEVAVGEFTVVETDPDGFNSVEDADGNNDNIVTGIVEAGEVSEDNDFIDEEPADISGQVTDDDDNDLAGEVPLAGVTVTLIDRNGDEFTTVTDENGEYTFEDIDPGPYTVIETDPGDFVSVGDVDGGDPNVITGVLMSGDDSEDNDFIDGICDELVCNGELQISLNHECLLELTPDMLLEFPSVGIYTIEIFDLKNEYLRDSFLTADDVGETRKYQISCLDNSCWGEIIVEANQIPEFISPCPLTEDGSIPADCIFWCGAEAITPDLLITPEEVKMTFGSCGPELIGEVLVRENRTGDICDPSGEIIDIVYTGKVMQHGEVRTIDILTQRYSVMKLDISGSDEDFDMNFGFPDDIILDCGSFTSPVDIYEITEDSTLAYPYYVDMHRLVNHKIRVIDTVEIIIGQVERDTMIKQLIGSDSLWVLKTIIDKLTELVPETTYIDNPDGPINPKVPIKDRVCNILTGYTDLTFDACGDGQKIIRSWEMIDWCSGDLIRTQKQIIEVKDVVKPKIYKLVNGKKVQINMLDDMIVGLEPWVCSAKIELPELIIEDNCDDNPTVEWYSDEGVVKDGILSGIWFDEGPVEVIGTVTDQCGNQDSVVFNVVIIDDVPPVATCDVALQIALTGNSDGYGTATLFAKDIDEGSHDSGCGKVKLTAVRAEDWVHRVRDCSNNFIGYEPVTCGAVTADIDAGEVVAKEGCVYNKNNIRSVTTAADFVRFCCEDAGKVVEVILIVEDEYGNISYCTVQVEVVDKAQPTIKCTQDVITCADDQTIKTPPLVGGICATEKTYEVQLLSENRSENVCSGGESIREWYIDIDESGDFNSGDSYCIQVISIEITDPFDPYTIKWPKHYDGKTVDGVNVECDDDGKVYETDIAVTMGDPFLCIPGEIDDEPVWCDTDCGLIGHTLDTDTIKIAGSVHKIIRRWTIVDWCNYDPNSDNRDDDNDTSNDLYEAVEDWAQGVCVACPDYGPVADPVYLRYSKADLDGYYTYDQVIVIEDDAAPEITAPDEFKIITSDGAETKDNVAACTGSSNISASAEDFCDGNNAFNDNLQWNVTIRKNGEVIHSERLRGSTITVNSREGNSGDVHMITWRVTDGKGNEDIHRTEVIFGDNVKPTPICISGLTTVFFEDDGTALITGDQFDFGSFDNCTVASDLNFSIVSKGVIPANPSSDGFSSETSIIINCNEIANFTDLDVYVWDASGNGDKCTVGLLFSNADNCPDDPQQGSGAIIAGGVQSLFGDMMKDVEVTVTSNLEEYPILDMTDENGEFAFDENPLSENYRIQASMVDDAINGVSTLDAVLIQRHILALANFDNPHKIIAADINNDATVKVSDILELRRLILGITDRFPNNESWRFVRASQNFIDEANPFPFIEMIDLINLMDNQMQENFIGIKTGDVNGDAEHSNLSSNRPRIRQDVTLELVTQDQEVRRGSVVKIPIQSSAFTEVAGFQFTLEHSGLSFNGIEGAGLEINDSHIGRHPEHLTFSWSNPEFNTVDETTLFYLIFTADEDLSIADRLVLTSEITAAEAYTSHTYDLIDVNFSITEADEKLKEVILYQNEPNPFSDETKVKFYLPESQNVNFVIFDLSGQIIMSNSMSLKSGEHSVIIPESDFNSSGVFYYQLETSTTTLTRKLILIE